MNNSEKAHKDGLEDEKAFLETLITDETVIDNQERFPEVKDTEASRIAPKSSAQQPLWAGKIMGRFKLLRLIGKGSMGFVIQAEDINLKRLVALKILRKHFLTNEKVKMIVEQFLREARAAASIDHPNIVRVFEINQNAGWWYIAMEMVAGKSLKEIIKAAGALPVSRACPIIADVAVGLEAAHKLGVIHRDIKPSNILVTRNGHGKVSDFGLVRIDDPNDPHDIYSRQSIGTPHYISPEMIRCETISSAVDIYSLGATLYHILTGRTPYNAKKIKDLLKQHLNADPPNLQQYLPGCSPKLTSLIQRMMAKDPDSRPTASEVAAILHAESIIVPSETSGIIDPESSTYVTQLDGVQQKTKTSMQETTGQYIETSLWKKLSLLPVKYKILSRVLLSLVVLLIIAGLIFRLYVFINPPGQDRRDVSKLFPKAPVSYNTGTIKTVTSLPQTLTDVPAFSWIGKVDISDFNFVASKSGRYFYSIGDERAVLIRADQFIGYQTTEQALKDGKQPAP